MCDLCDRAAHEGRQDEFTAAQRDGDGNYLMADALGQMVLFPAWRVDEIRAERAEKHRVRAVATHTRPPFALERTCVKCGYGGAPDERPPKVTYHRDMGESAPEFGHGPALARTCRRCRYAWAERCLDDEYGEWPF